MALDAGYYGLCAVSSEAKGPLSEIDHWVLLCGHRSYEVPLAHLEGARRLQQELLVSSSSTLHPTEEWVEVGPFLRERGGFNVLLARPAERRQDEALASTR